MDYKGVVMILHDWLVEKFIPLFGSVDTVLFEAQDFFTLTSGDIFDFFFYLVLSVLVVSLFLILPYKFFRWIMNGCRRRRK